MCDPLPVPSESIDFTPPALWPVIRAQYPGGVEMPSAVPARVWEKEWRKRNRETDRDPPPAPALLKCYWGKLKGRALESRKAAKRARKDHLDEDESLPPCLPTKLPDEIWKKYFDIFPYGHSAPGYSAGDYQQQPREDPAIYKFVRGSLHVLANGIWRPSRGVDVWNPDGTWAGPG